MIERDKPEEGSSTYKYICKNGEEMGNSEFSEKGYKLFEEEKRELDNLSLLTQEGLQGGEQKFRGSANKNKNICF